jgi:paraquat-inducible protein B
MSRQASKTVIGAFVVGAVALLVAGVLLFGSGRFFSERKTFVLFFSKSVKGLNVGSPVNLRGVRIGSVTDINVQFDPKTREFMIPVLIELDPAKISLAGMEKSLLQLGLIGKGELMRELIDRGLRAQLQAVSLVTGQLGIDLDFYPGTVKLLRATDETYIEIPTIPSSMEQLENTLEKVVATVQALPLQDLVQNLADAAKGIKELVNSPEMGGSIRSLKQTLDDVRVLVQNLNDRVGPVAETIEGTVKDVQKVVKHIDEKVVPISNGIEQSLTAAHGALQQMQETLANMEKMTASNSTLKYQLAEMMEQISSAARSLRIMADYLERHPEGLLRGKSEGGKE